MVFEGVKLKGNVMFKGTVTCMAKIKGNGLRFPLVEFNPNEPGVHKVEMEGPNGDEIRTTVHLAAVESHEYGRAVATKVNTAALNRICFNHGIAIEKRGAQATNFPHLTLSPVSSRLRNEFAHKRASVNLDNTKSEMANWLGGLIGLTKRAIELHP